MEAAPALLLVEDNPGDERLLREILRPIAGAPAIVAVGSLREALAAVAARRFDLVVTDLYLPDADGIAACARLCAAAPDSAVVVITGSHDRSLGDQAIAAGAQDCLVKDEITTGMLQRVLRFARERHRIARALREAEARTAQLRFLAVARCARDAIIGADRAGRITFWNDGARLQFALGHDEAVGRDLCSLFAATDREDLRDALARAPTAAIEPMAITGLGRDGATFPAELTIATLPAEAGGAGGLVAVVRDITARRRIIDHLVKARDEAEAAVRAKSTFLAVMSHELRTPLHGVIGMAELMADAGLPGEQREHLATIQQCAQSLLHLVNGMLDFARLETGHLPIAPEPCSLREVIDDALAQAAAGARQQPIALAGRVATEVPWTVVGDGARIRQIITALLDNAVKFTERGEVTVEAHQVAAAAGTVRVAISVRDTGIGIPADILPRLFTPFTQGDSSVSRRYGGTGLGLSICARLAELMGGEIVLASEPGRGTTATLHLPLPLSPVQERPEPSLSGLRAMIAVAHPLARDALAEALAEAGAAVAIGADPLDMDPSAFDIAVIDAEIAGGAELPAIGRIRTMPGGDRLAVLALYPLGGRPSSYALRQHGVTASIARPVRHAHMVRLLCTLFKGDRPATASGGILRLAGAPRILVADPDPLGRQCLTGLLSRLGCVVDACVDGGEAMQRIASTAYDLILMDCVVGGIDGLTATRAIRARADRCATVAVIALVDEAGPAQRQRCLDAGMDHCLVRPVLRADLLAAVERWAGRRHGAA